MATEFLSQDKIQDDQERGRSVEAVVHGNRGVKAAAEGAASATSGQIGAGSPPSAISGIARGGSGGGASGGGTAAKAKNAKPKVNGGGGKAKKKALLGTGDFSALVMVLNDWTEMQRLDFMDCHQMTQFQFGMMMTVLSRPGCDGPQVAALLEDLHIEGANLSIAHLAAILVERTKDFTYSRTLRSKKCYAISHIGKKTQTQVLCLKRTFTHFLTNTIAEETLIFKTRFRK